MNVAKVFIAGGFILVIIAIIGSLFYFIVVEHKLSRANTSLRGIRVNECFLDSGLNLAIDDMDRYHTRTSELFLTSNWIYLICSILYLLIWIALCFYMKGKSSKSYYSEEEKWIIFIISKINKHLFTNNKLTKNYNLCEMSYNYI